MLGNKEIMAHNIKKYMSIKGVTSADVCRALGFKTNTFSNWITAKIYPRIDKIEMLATYFGISKRITFYRLAFFVYTGLIFFNSS